ncbi:hypothetical protein JW935_18160 [candidate division KSB1 bacterium]|nr:hypothetical protein [candidate division KSB1 bacterium]
MKKGILFYMFCLFTATAFAQQTDWSHFILDSPKNQFALNLPQDATAQAPQGAPEGLYSVKKALLFSAVVPGAGQAYTGSYFKAGGFLLVEAAAWTVYALYNSKGNDIEDEFHKYADEHWSEDDYWYWIAGHSGIDRENMDALREWEHKNFSHGLHLEKDQQYYEMIGKYDQFNYAWDDSEIGLLDTGWSQSLRSKHRLYYEDRRDASNNAFKTATWGITVAMLNHILSAAEAAFGAKHKNDAKISADVHVKPLYQDGRIYTALSLNVSW